MVMSNFSRLRSRLSPAEAGFYEFLWAHYKERKAWPSTWHVYRTHLEKRKLSKVITATRYVLHTENSSVHPRTYELQSIGILATAKGETYRQWLVSLFVYLRDRFYNGDDRQILVNQAEVQEALKLTADEADELGYIVRGGILGLNPNWQPNTPGWQLYLPYHVVEEFPRNGPLKRQIGALLDGLLAQAKRSRKRHATPPLMPMTEDLFYTNSAHDASDPRRYQVFVSSTFEDLKEERQ